MANEKCVCDYCRYRYSWDCDVEIIKVDNRKSYVAFPGCPFRLVIEDGEYVGWYYCGERKDNES